jgi:ADP-heptose:LPS heptosyltransferase/GT2 family glycosyltransferase
MKHQPYIIWSDAYFHASAGVRVVHKLCHLLNQAGENASIYGLKKTNPQWQERIVAPPTARKLIAGGAIVVYPEVVFGNPLFARNVVRYILNTPGLLGGEKQYAKSELLFCYLKALLQPGMTRDRIFCIPVTDKEIFYNDPDQPRDIDYLIYFGRKGKIKRYPESKIIYSYKPKTAVLADRLRRCKKLISYDNFSALNFEATLCGCPVLIIPDGSRKKEDLENSEFGLNGIAWGETSEEWEKALRTLPEAPKVLAKIESVLPSALSRFVKCTQEKAAEKIAYRSKLNKSLSIIVLNHNGERQLKENLPSIIENLDPAIPTELLLVDNGSKDESLVWLKNNYPQFRIINLGSNLHFCRALNEGARQAGGELLYFLNNDIKLTKGSIAPLVGHFQKEEIFGASPRVIRPLQGNINESIIVGDFRGGIINAWFTRTSRLALPNRPLTVFSLCGAAMMIEKEKFFELGGFDEMLSPFYYEETDLSYRAQKRGWQLLYEPNSLVYHQHDQTIGKQFKKGLARWSYRKNQYLCTWKNIHDPLLLAKHILLMVLPKVLIPNLLEWRALAGALKQLPEIIKKRKQPYQFTDRQIFRLADEQKRRIDLLAKIKSILVIRPDAIGDLVLTLPAIQSLKENFPEAKITVLAREYTAPLLKNHPAVDAIIYDYDFRKYNFDLSVNFHNQFKDTWATFKAGIPYRIGDSSRILTAGMNNFRVFRNWNDRHLHEVEQNMALLKPLGITAPAGKPLVVPDPASLSNVDALFKKSGNPILQYGVLQYLRLAGLHCGSSTSKAWPPENFAALAKFLLDNNYYVFILGGEGEKSAAAIIKQMVPRAIDFAGKLSLSDLIALISKLSFYTGMDTGPTHIAAAFSIPTVMLFLNPIAPPHRWGPWLTRHRTVTPKKGEKEISTAVVLSAVRGIINGEGVSGLAQSRAHWLAVS